MNFFFTFVLLLDVAAHASSEEPTTMMIAEADEDIDPKCFKDHTINTANDLLSISDCSIVSGSLVIQAFDTDLLSLGSIIKVNGNLLIKNASKVVRIEALELQSVAGTFELNTLTSLNDVSFPKLQSVDTMKWKVLPILSSVNLDAGIKEINSVILSDTSLTAFGGFNVDTLKTLQINNNRFLDLIDSSVKEVSGDILVAANANGAKLHLPELKWVKNIMIKNIDDVDLKSLQVVEGSAEFIENTQSELKVAKLKSVGKTLSIIKNQQLVTIEFPALSEISGGLMVIKNDRINEVAFLPSLKSVGGAVELEGNIDRWEFKQLRIVKGAAKMKTSSSKLQCSDWVEHFNKVVRGGKIECSSRGSETESVLVDESGRAKSIREKSGALGVAEMLPGALIILTTILFFQFIG